MGRDRTLRRRCPLCGEPWSNDAVHHEVPYLAWPDDRTVFYCLEAGRHVRVPRTWADDIRASIEDVLGLLDIPRRYA